MQVLIDADLPRATAELLRKLGHEPVDVRDVGLGAAPDAEIAAYAQDHQLCLMTGDFGFADIRNYPPQLYAGIVVLVLPKKATRDIILRLIAEVFQQSDVVERFPGRLAIVEFGRVRLRPA